MILTTGSCPGIENYSRYLTGRKQGEPPPTLFEYLPQNALLFVDESHVAVPQVGGMFKGDWQRKSTLAEFGFRLPSCTDNRPLKFQEWDAMRPQTTYVSATPASWELERTGGVFVEQVIRPTGLVDPVCIVRPVEHQVDDLLAEVRDCAARSLRVLVTTLTKRMAEDLSEYLHEQGVQGALPALRHRHAGAHRDHPRPAAGQVRRAGRHQPPARGLDIPECGLVAILDADKEGYLRSETSLIQTIGRAARNVDGRVILYADTVTRSLEAAMGETERRRMKQLAFNEANGITPQTIKRNIHDVLRSVAERDYVTVDVGEDTAPKLAGLDLHAHVGELEKRMRDAAANLEFEEAATLRDEIKRLEEQELGMPVRALQPGPGVRAQGAAWKPSSGSREEKRRAADAKRKGLSRRRVGK